jgi:hypothetical protein
MLVLLALPAFSAAQTENPISALTSTAASGNALPTVEAEALKVFVEEAAPGSSYQTGLLQSVYSDGVDVVERLPAKEKRKADDSAENEERFADAQVASDKKTLGWTESYDSCCQCYPMTLVLALYRSGKIIQRMRNRMLWSWMFLDAGRRVAVELGPTHGPEVGHYLLDDVNIGRMLSEVWGAESIQKLQRNAPNWAKRPEAMRRGT